MPDSNVKLGRSIVSAETLPSWRKFDVLHTLDSCLYDSPITYRRVITPFLNVLNNEPMIAATYDTIILSRHSPRIRNESGGLGRGQPRHRPGQPDVASGWRAHLPTLRWEHEGKRHVAMHGHQFGGFVKRNLWIPGLGATHVAHDDDNLRAAGGGTGRFLARTKITKLASQASLRRRIYKSP